MNTSSVNCTESSTKSSRPGDTLKFNLAFRDSLLESEYLLDSYRSNRQWIIGGLAGLTLLVLLASPSPTNDPSVGQLDLIRTLRFAVWLPALASGIVAVMFLKNPRILIPCMAAMCTYLVIGTFITPTVGTSASQEWPLMYLACLTTIYTWTGLPFRWAISIVLCLQIWQAATIQTATPVGQSLLLVVGSGSLGWVLTFAAYWSEKSSRETFRIRNQTQREHRERLALERNRIRWLETITGFLSHELKSATAGISCSLDLATRGLENTEPSTFVDRAKRSLNFMERFLRQTTEATSLEAALSGQDLEIIDLSQLIEGRIRDFGEENQSKNIMSSVQQNIFVRGNTDRLVQMFDKLVNNAFEHSNEAHPIEIELRRHAGIATLSVRDIGDALPTDLDAIFEPFVSEKVKRGGGNLGLGLYVARVVVAYHGGTIRAKRLDNPMGAEFVVELPLQS